MISLNAEHIAEKVSLLVRLGWRFCLSVLPGISFESRFEIRVSPPQSRVDSYCETDSYSGLGESLGPGCLGMVGWWLRTKSAPSLGTRTLLTALWILIEATFGIAFMANELFH